MVPSVKLIQRAGCVPLGLFVLLLLFALLLLALLAPCGCAVLRPRRCHQRLSGTPEGCWAAAAPETGLPRRPTPPSLRWSSVLRRQQQQGRRDGALARGACCRSRLLLVLRTQEVRAHSSARPASAGRHTGWSSRAAVFVARVRVCWSVKPVACVWSRGLQRSQNNVC